MCVYVCVCVYVYRCVYLCVHMSLRLCDPSLSRVCRESEGVSLCPGEGLGVQEIHLTRLPL